MMLTFKGIVCVGVYLSCLCFQQSEQCIVRGSGDQNLPSFSDYGNSGVTRITLHHQAIIPSYEFADCCGNITEWGVDVQPGDNGNMLYTLDLQVWRPSPTVDDSTGDGQYRLVGNNRFTSISLDGGVAQVTPLTRNQVQFRPGDVLGFYVEEAMNNMDGVNVLTTSYTSERVWYASVTTLNTMGCPVSVGSGGILNTELRGAPVISIDTETYNCPDMTSTPPPCPTATTTTPQPTMSPTVPTDPAAGPITTTMEPETDEPSIEPETGDSTTAEMVTDNPFLSPTPTEDMEFTTEPVSVISTEDNRVPSTGGADGGNVIVIVVVVTLLTIILAILIAFLVAFVILKKRSKAFTITHTQLRFGSPNYPIAQVSNTQKDAYTLVDKQLPSVKYSPSSERVELNGIGEDQGTYHETVLYHSTGPNILSPKKSENNEHIYVDAPFYSEVDGAVSGAVGPVYEDPTISQAGLHYEFSDSVSFGNFGVYVPTEAERKKSRKFSANHPPKAYDKLDFFVEESIYWAPACTTSDLYSQLASKKYREIPREEINILEQLGSGEFGQVYKAVWSISGATKELAVKTLRTELPEEEKVRFLQEAAIMGQFSHPNVIKLYGVVTVGEPIMICLELMANRDLRHYLCSIVPSKDSAKELKMQFLRFSKQIACGMNYLANKAFIHRDLAARNVLLDNILDCKIGDFGLARDLVYETYYKPSTKGGKLPVKWMAPEALLYKKYSTDSDVWSYGMVLFEVWSVGMKPFSQLSNSEVIRLVNTGYNQPPPPSCPRAIYQLMVNCWNPVHSKRPSFADIDQYLSSSVDLLLQWVEEDDSHSSQVGLLGAPLSEADSLYKDLQNVYADRQ